MDSTPSRSFLGFDSGFLVEVARTLLKEHGTALGSVLVLVPGRRAGRKLLETLVHQAGHAIEPPRIVTEAVLAQELALRPSRAASPIAVEWAWFETLERATSAELAPFTPTPDAALSWGLRLSLARQLAALDRERAAEEGGPAAEEVEADSLAGRRRTGLAIFSARARKALADIGRSDPARALEPLRESAGRRADLQIVVAGLVEISPALRAVLRSLEPRPRILIQATPDMHAGFDEWGALVPAFWEPRPIPLRDAEWLPVDDPAAASRAGLDWIAQLPDGTRTDELAIGVLDESLLPGMTQAFAARGQALHAAAGERGHGSAPWLALDALHAWLARGDFAALAGALRHPDVEAVVGAGRPAGNERASTACLDLWHSEHLPDVLGAALPGEDATSLRVRHLRAGLDSLCGELAQAEQRPLGAWTRAIVEVICRLYPNVESEAAFGGWRTRAALEGLGELARELQGYPQSFWHSPMRGEQALRLWLDWSAEMNLRAPREPGAVEAMGWLELAMEEAPFLLLVGLNEGWLPQSQRVNPILGEAPLPLGLRQRTRLARDIHALTVIALRRGGGSGKSGLCALSLRRGTGEQPLRPSRLLFHAAEDTAIARAQAFFATAAPAARGSGEASGGPQAQARPIPCLPPYRPVSISGFKTYLNSPYEYYLQKVLKLERVRDDAWELDAADFGSLVHGVLQRFGAGECRDSTDATEIEACLQRELRALAHARYGERPLPAVRLQLQQLQRRLQAFAQCQALEAAGGWKIHATELELREASLDVDDVVLEICGRVDRIDRHKDGRWRILDYKTGDDSYEPRKAHLTGNGWKDLQLPLYWHCLRADHPGEIQLGYFAIPRKLEHCGVRLAEFTPEELAAALEVARSVLRGIRAGTFSDGGRAAPRDRVQRALFGLSLLCLDEEPESEEDDLNAGGAA